MGNAVVGGSGSVHAGPMLRRTWEDGKRLDTQLVDVEKVSGLEAHVLFGLGLLNLGVLPTIYTECVHLYVGATMAGCCVFASLIILEGAPTSNHPQALGSNTAVRCARLGSSQPCSCSHSSDSRVGILEQKDA